MSGFVYIWTNKINNKQYIGSHVGTENDNYLGSGKAFNRAIEKYGIDNFDRVILEYVEDNLILREKEQYYIDFYDAANNKMFYNMKSKVGGGFEFINDDPVHQEHNIQRLKTRWQEKQHPKGMLGKKHTKENMEKTKAGWNEWAKKNLLRPVEKYTIDGVFLEEYESMTAAAKSVNGNGSNIKYTIEGKFKHAYGYKWKYKNQ
jgi:hypothetical protein